MRVWVLGGVGDPQRAERVAVCGTAGEQVPRRGRDQGSRRALSRDGHRGLSGGVSAQEADERERAIRRRVPLIVDGAAPRNYIPAVEKGVVESLPRGTFPLTNLRVVLYDCKHHDVDSSEMAFKLAATQALKDCVSSSRPLLLEPIHSLHFTVPESSLKAEAAN